MKNKIAILITGLVICFCFVSLVNAEPICGDGVCVFRADGTGENCNTCPRDCPCPSRFVCDPSDPNADDRGCVGSVCEDCIETFYIEDDTLPANGTITKICFKFICPGDVWFDILFEGEVCSDVQKCGGFIRIPGSEFDEDVENYAYYKAPVLEPTKELSGTMTLHLRLAHVQSDDYKLIPVTIDIGEYVPPQNLEVTSTHPAQGDCGVSVYTDIVVTFSMSVTNVNENTFQVSYDDDNGDTQKVSGEISSTIGDDTKFKFVPESPLPCEKQINVTIKGGENGVKVKDAAPPIDHSFSFYTFPNIDVKVIQTVEDAEYTLVARKPTMVRVFVGQFKPGMVVTAKVKLLIDNVDVGLIKENVPLKDNYTPYERKKGKNSVNFFIPQSRNFATEGYHYVKAIIEPDDKKILELAGESNCKEKACYVRVPRQTFEVKYVALNVGKWEHLNAAEVASYLLSAKVNSDFLQAVYPVSYSSYLPDISCTQIDPGWVLWQHKTTSAFKALEKYAAANRNTDRVVGIFPKDWLKAAGGCICGKDAVIIKEGTHHYPVAAHEIMHTYGKYCGDEEDYKKNKPYGRLADDGWWVDEGESGCSVNIDKDRWNVVEWLCDGQTDQRTYVYFSYMGNGTGPFEYWTNKTDYKFLYGKIVSSTTISSLESSYLKASSSSSKLILLSGIIRSDGSVTIDPIISGDCLDPEEEEPDTSNSYLEFYHDTTLLKTYRFSITEFTDAPEIQGWFVVTVEMPENTNAIHIKRSDGTPIATISKSDNAPGVELTYPNGGEFLTGDVDITWTAEDADGDSLNYTLYFSDDGGSTWRTIAMDREGTSYHWDSSFYPGGDNRMLKIVASDGFNTAEDTTDSAFSLADKAPFVAIIKPENNTVFGEIEDIYSDGVAYDPQGDTFDFYDFNWTSDIDGHIGTGKTLSLSSLSLGKHEIKLKVKNSAGLTGTSESIFITVSETSPPDKKTIYVDDDFTDDPANHRWDTIQEGITDANDGDTVLVYTGTYTETVVLNKSLTLIGKDKPTIDASGTGNAITITADNCIVKGFTCVNAYSSRYAGIRVESNNNVIEDNTCKNNDIGIVLVTASDNIIAHNTATNNDKNGIYLQDSNNNRITDNTASNSVNYHGISLDTSNNNEIRDNNANYNHYQGIRLRTSNENIIANNAAENNDEYGIALWTSDANIVANNMAKNNGEIGILLSASQNNKITDNDASNTVKYDGISLLDSSSNNEIANNTANSNNFNGIRLYSHSDKNILTNNIANSNREAGILCWTSSGNILTYNDLNSNKYGFWLYNYSSDNILANNTATSNSYGIYVAHSSNNNIYLNNFVDNTDNAYSYNSNNIWRSASKLTHTYNSKSYWNYLGNYWSDYRGSDADGDGIGDSSYSIDGDEDEHPLMKPWENYFAP